MSTSPDDLGLAKRYEPILNALTTIGIAARLVANGVGDVAITAQHGARRMMITDPNGGMALDPGWIPGQPLWMCVYDDESARPDDPIHDHDYRNLDTLAGDAAHALHAQRNP